MIRSLVLPLRVLRASLTDIKLLLSNALLVQPPRLNALFSFLLIQSGDVTQALLRYADLIPISFDQAVNVVGARHAVPLQRTS
jgi:hypothetical protein